MGVSDLIPGISSSTIAIFLGIYFNLLSNIKKIDYKSIFKLEFKRFFKSIDFRFFIPLAIGIFFSLICFSKLFNYLLFHESFRKLVLSFFLGAILTCIYFLFKEIKLNKAAILFMLLGAFLSFIIAFVNSNAFDFSLNLYLKLVISGFIAIFATLLPGISGSFILLILGIYPIIINALANISKFQNIKILSFLSFGIFLGLVTFPRFILFFLNKYYHLTMSFLIGLMIGSIYAIWPFYTYRKSYLDTNLDSNLDSKVILLNDKIQFPNILSFEFAICFTFILFGIFVFFAIKQISAKKYKKINEDTCI